MALLVKHSTVVSIPDDGTSPVGTDEWNAAHTISGTIDATNVGAAGSSGQVQFNNGGVLGADSGFTYAGSGGALTYTGVGATLNITGVTNAIKIGPDPSSPTYNTISLNGTLVFDNAIGITGGGGTDGSMYLSVPAGGHYSFSVGPTEAGKIDFSAGVGFCNGFAYYIAVAGSGAEPGLYVALNGEAQDRLVAALDNGNQPLVAFGPGGSTAVDTNLERYGAGVLGLSGGNPYTTNSSTPATFKVFNIVDVIGTPTNWEAGIFGWQSNVLTIGTTYNGTGSARAVQFVAGGGVLAGAFSFITGADTNIVLGHDAGGGTYNILSLSGVNQDGGNIGLVGGATGDGILYVESTGGIALIDGNHAQVAVDDTFGLNIQHEYILTWAAGGTNAFSQPKSVGLAQGSPNSNIAVYNPSSLASAAGLQVYNNADPVNGPYNAVNYERLVVDFTTTSNVATIGTQFGGTGSARNLQFVVGNNVVLDYSITHLGAWTALDAGSQEFGELDATYFVSRWGHSGDIPGFYLGINTDTQSGTTGSRIILALDGGNNPFLGFGPGGTSALDIVLNRQAAGVFGVGTSPTNTSGALVLASVTAPLIIGGTTASSTLTLESTSGAGTTDMVLVKTGSQVEAARFDSSQRVTINTGAVLPNVFAVNPQFQMSSLADGMDLRRYSNDTSSVNFTTVKSRGTTIGSNVAVVSGDGLFSISASGYDNAGTPALQRAAAFNIDVDTTVASGIVPGRFRFRLTNAAGAFNEVLRLDSAANVIVGTVLAFSSTFTSPDTGLARNAAGVVEFNSGTAGTLRDWTARNGTLSTNFNLGNNTVLTGPGAGQFEVAIGGTNELDFGVTTASVWSLGAELDLKAGTTSIAPLKFKSGTNLTSATAGACEFDGTAFYHTAVASARQVVDCEQVECLSSTRTFANNTNAQAIFNLPTNGAVTLAAATTYEFEMLVVATGFSSSSHTLNLTFAAGGSFTSIGYYFNAQTGSTLATPTAALTGFVAVGTATAICAATTTTGLTLYVRGTMRINSGGTVTPQLTQVTASAAAVVQPNSFFRCWPIGSNTVTTVGNWS